MTDERIDVLKELHRSREYVDKEKAAARENVKAQLANPDRVNKDHIKKSLIWNTTQNIRQIQRQLCEGYSFDKDILTALVNAMFGFINSVAKPDSDQCADVQVEEVIK
jgi:hypothetical protein